MTRFVLAWLFAVSICSAVFAQSRSGVAVGYSEAWQHAVEPMHTWAHVPGYTWDMTQLRLVLTISPQGDVVHAEAHGDPEEMKAWPAAQAVVYGWKYRPFLRDGHPVTAEVESSILLVPPAIPLKEVPKPVLRPDSKIAISLRRTTCYGTCPSYTVTVSEQGVVYEGRQFVAIAGTHRAPVKPGAVRGLAQRMIAANWFGMEDTYAANATDSPSQTVTLTVDGRTKKVVDYVGIHAGMPDVVEDVEYEIDRTAGSDRWVNAVRGLAPLLRQEGFDFRSYAAQSALRTAATRGDVASVRELLAAGVPRARVPKPAENPNGNHERSSFDGLLTAAVRQPEVLRMLMAAGVSSNDAVDKNIALAAAVSAGNAGAAHMLLRYGANPNMDFATLQGQMSDSPYWLKKSTSLLTNAARSGDPETVRLVLAHVSMKTLPESTRRDLLINLAETSSREESERRAECARLLLEAGADVHATDDDQNTALHLAHGVPFITVLVQAGADVNAQDKDGNTPAFLTSDPAVFRFLAAHGADLRIRNHAGKNALENPQRSLTEWGPVYAEIRTAQGR